MDKYAVSFCVVVGNEPKRTFLSLRLKTWNASVNHRCGSNIIILFSNELANKLVDNPVFVGTIELLMNLYIRKWFYSAYSITCHVRLSIYKINWDAFEFQRPHTIANHKTHMSHISIKLRRACSSNIVVQLVDTLTPPSRWF